MKVELIAAISLNGKIGLATNQSSLEWTSKEDTKFFVEKTKQAGVMIMGRKTFETIGRALPGRQIIVMTCDPETHFPIQGVEFTKSSPQDILRDLQTRRFTTVVIAGGAGVYSLFLREKLITDVYLTLEPILFGQGVPLAEDFGDVKLEWVESKQLGEQSIMLHYRVL